jgi:hypothetical protein
MGGCLRQLVLLSSVLAKCREFWLLAACILAALSLAISEPALAQCAGPASNTICTSGGNTYPTGINVNTDNGLGGTPINLQLLSGVNVTIPAGVGSVNAVNTANTGGVTPGSADITIITEDGVIISNTANPGTTNNTGLRIQSSGAATITATNTTIDVAGTASDWAILAFAMPNGTGTPHDVSVNWSGPRLTSATSIEGGGIQADNRSIGNASVVASGDIKVVGPRPSPHTGGSGAFVCLPLLGRLPLWVSNMRSAPSSAWSIDSATAEE